MFSGGGGGGGVTYSVLYVKGLAISNILLFVFFMEQWQKMQIYAISHF